MNAPHSTRQARDEGFDAAMRALHRDALARLAPATRWNLRPAAADEAPPAGAPVHWRWPRMPVLAGGALAACALALGIALWRPGVEPAPPGTGGATAAAQAQAGALDEDPDFYAWLASDDAGLIALE